MSGYTPFRRERLEEPAAEPEALAPSAPEAPPSRPAELHVLGVPPEWSAGMAKLRAAPVPDGCSAGDWETLMQGAEGFLQRWGASAARQGWTAEELFSLHPVAPFGRLDGRGVAFMVGAVTAVSADTIRLRSIRGTSDLTLYRRWLNPGPPAWERFTNEEPSDG